MNVVFRNSSNTEIEIVELIGRLAGHGAVEFKETIFFHMEQKPHKAYLLINFKQVKKIDGLGVGVLECLVNRGIDIRMFNVGVEIRSILKLFDKNALLDRIYDETDGNNVVSMLEKDTSVTDKWTGREIKIRNNPRVNTFFPVDFRYRTAKNKTVVCNAKASNLSEYGIYVEKVKAVDLANKEVVRKPDLLGQEFHDIKFKMGSDLDQIKTEGICIWNKETLEDLDVGIRFKNMKEDYIHMVRHYVYSILRL